MVLRSRGKPTEAKFALGSQGAAIPAPLVLADSVTLKQKLAISGQRSVPWRDSPSDTARGQFREVEVTVSPAALKLSIAIFGEEMLKPEKLRVLLDYKLEDDIYEAYKKVSSSFTVKQVLFSLVKTIADRFELDSSWVKHNRLNSSLAHRVRDWLEKRVKESEGKLHKGELRPLFRRTGYRSEDSQALEEMIVFTSGLSAVYHKAAEVNISP